MEEKPAVAQSQNEKIASRRSRKDEEGRDYQCGCGKRYLSYPALYTHIKTKHEGKQPQGTLKTGISIITKRAKIKLEDQTLRHILALFEDFAPETTSKIEDNLRGSFPLNARIKKDGVPKEIYEQYVLLTKQHEFKLSEHCSLDLALALFLINMGEHVNDKVYDQFLIFARLARACFFEFGEELYRAVFAKKETGPFQLKDFSLQYARYFPLVADFFVRYYLAEIDNKDRAEANRSLMEVIVYDFCNWLKIRKLTNLKVSFTRTVQVDFKPSVNVKAKPVPGKAQIPKQQYEKEEIKEQNEDESEELSENEQIEEELQNEDKNPSGSKDNQQIE